ncbi:MAG: TIGR03790 family protein, partial [Nitrospirae bacterium]|nr:TIGR03790 family protein [Nitrospirota bacterium]
MRQAYAIILILLFCFIALAPALSEAMLRPEEVLVVVNTEAPDSVRLGKLYIELRRVPASNIAEIKVPVQDDIARKQYDEMIATPLKKIVKGLQGKGTKIRCIVTMYGVPLRVSSERPADIKRKEAEKVKDLLERKKGELSTMKELSKTEPEKYSGKVEDLDSEVNRLTFDRDHMFGFDTIAALDAELPLLLSPSYQLAGWQPNPEFIYMRGQIKDRAQTIMVSRLDAPSPGLVEKIIRTSIEVEKTGLSGTFYLDARG